MKDIWGEIHPINEVDITSNPGMDYEKIVKLEVIAYMRGKINGDDALKCAVALGKRHFAIHTLFTYLKDYIVKG